ncbi:MAG TPA: methyl-accepting chemotaxis protein [Gammaproteobacteria bacterium]|nr:methyl-accepting chemotaxis protein [Gammaproteobacteria bacterium]
MLLIAAGCIVAAAVNFFYTARFAIQDEAFLRLLSDQSVLSQSLAKDGGLAVRGNNQSFTFLQTGREQFDRNLREMLDGSERTARVSDQVRDEVSLMQQRWSNEGRDAVGRILAAKDAFSVAHQSLAVINAQMPEFAQRMDEVFNKLSGNNAVSRSWLYHLGRQSSFAQRMQRDVNTVILGGSDVAGAANRLEGDLSYVTQIMRAMFDGDPQLGLPPLMNTPAAEEIRTANVVFNRVRDAVTTVESMSASLVEAHAALGTLEGLSSALLANSRTILNAFERQKSARLFQPLYGYVAGGVGVLLLLVLFSLYNLGADTRRAAEAQAREQERNQEAILRLLDELGSLADGDLTVQATVSEDITGAIADSINFAIEALRDLVLTVNDTALRVDAAARQTQATASHLAEASDNQTRQIASATKQIAAMAKSIEQVSANAERSTRVAQQSVEIANKGGEAVRRTIDGMNNIRETIQETSKRIKRLGESSQEIGDIVELINDIAEQTNILALNAAIQASMAGEAGRGFAVVADEVQRLAERSANATKQIEALVKTIQTDTNEAVISMEQSTAGVVSGAQLAENAGEALDEIVKVSNHIATLIQSISAAARQQATAATDVSRTMNVIQEITSQTAEGTQATARNIGKLATLATELRKSVAGFKLPNMGGGETMVMTAEMQVREVQAAEQSA